MLSLASFHLRNFYLSALDYLQTRPPTPSAISPDPHSPEHTATPNSNNLRDSILTSDAHAICLDLSPTSPRPSRSPLYMRRELEYTRTELVRTKNDVSLLEDRCKILERTLKDTRDLLRVREAEVEKVRKERDKERRLSDRKRSDSLHHPPRSDVSRHNSLNMKPSSSLHPNGRSSNALKPSPSTATSTAITPAAVKARFPTPSTASSAPRTQATGTLTAAEERARLKSSEAYLTRTDSWSGAQVLQAIQDINSEIFQFSASATEVCAFSPAAVAARSSQAVHDTSGRLGPKFARILTGRDHSQDPLLVQWALQGCTAVCIARALSAFCFGFPAEADNILSQIYRRMALAEPQPTSSKWRALTHRNIHAVYPTLDDYAIQKLVDTIVRWSADIFYISGCTSFNDPSSTPLLSTSPPLSLSTSPPNSRPLSDRPSLSDRASRASLASSHASLTSYASSHTSTTTSTTSTTTSANPGISYIRESLKTLFGDQIRRLARSATQLATTLREEILSTSFDVVTVDHTQTFDGNTMVDMMRECGYNTQSTLSVQANGHANGSGVGPAVLATTELGLLCTTRIGNRESVGDEDVTIEKRLILKPKVVLENVLEMLDR